MEVPIGLSSSKTTQKVDQNTTGTTQQQGTTTPQLPGYLSDITQDYFGRIGALGDMDPNSFIAPASPLQNMAYQNAPQALSNWQGQASTAAGLLQQIAGGAPKGTGGQMQAPGMNAAQASTTPMQAAQPGSPSLVSGQGYSEPTLGSFAPVFGRGYNTPELGQAQGYAAARTGAPIGQAAQVGQASTINPMSYDLQSHFGYQPTAATAGDISGNISRFQNPYVNDVVNSSLAQHEQSLGQQQARLAAQGAKAGAFGGSRFGIAEGQLGAQGALDRASLESGLRSQAYQQAANLAGQQAGLDQSTSMFNATGQNEGARYAADQGNTNMRLNQQSRLGLASQNMAAENARTSQQAGLDQQMGLANLGTQSQFALDQAGRQDQASQFGLGLQQQRDMANAGFQNDANRFGAESQINADQFNANNSNQFALQRAAMGERASQFNASNAQQAALANQGAQNQFALAGAGMQNDASQFNAGAQNAASQFNAGQQNQMSMFGQGLQGEQQARALQAALGLQQGALGFADSTRQDLGTMAALGEQQRGIEQQYNLAPLAQLQAMGQLGQFPFGALVGQQVNSNGSMTGNVRGTTTTTQSPSMFDQLMQGAQFASMFI